MTEAMLNLSCPLDVLASANGAGLRWTPGPDELRLPSCEDEPVSQNGHQVIAMVDCFDSLRRHWRGRRDASVAADQFVYWDPAYDSRKNPENPPAAPDVYVALGVANRVRSSYVVWEEGKPPDFVLEIVSPSSRRRDEKDKPVVYAKIGVPEFFLFDPEGKWAPALRGFELRAGSYVPLPCEALEDGVVGIRSEKLGLWLCVKPPVPDMPGGTLCWYDPAVGEFLPTGDELADGKQQAEARAAVSDARAEAAFAEAEAAAAKARASEARAAASEARAEASDAKVAELEALIEKMRRG